MKTQYTKTPTSILQTDFYELTMSYAYLMLKRAGEKTGFESFIRKIKPNITDKDFYIFDGENEIHDFMSKIKEEILNESCFFERFWEMISDKVDIKNYEICKKEFMKMDKNFEYSVLENGDRVYPKVPVFQFSGPKMIGQLLETPITNIINGRVGMKSYNKEIKLISNEVTEDYKKMIDKRARQYRDSTKKIILEAGYRRSANFEISCYASMSAIKNGWNGTSNTCLFNVIDKNLINGTMAHAFIMSYGTEENEIKAFKDWNNIFPNSTLLIDTYDSVKAVKKLIENNIKPNAVRIDSDPIEKIAHEVRIILDNAGWDEVKIFLSGDITPEKLIKWEEDNVPFDICMAGTKFVNIGEVENINPGFVYKVVEYKKDGKIFYPVKKAEGKSNYPGLKKIHRNYDQLIVESKNNYFGIERDIDYSKIKEVVFI